MKHLYIFEDGTPCAHNHPTSQDLECVKEGVLQIFKFMNGEIYEYTADLENTLKLVPIASIEIDDSKPYHVPNK